MTKKAGKTPVFVRISTVLGSRGSADTARDTHDRDLRRRHPHAAVRGQVLPTKAPLIWSATTFRCSSSRTASNSRTASVAGGTTPSNDITLVVLLQEAFRHCKPMSSCGDGAAALSGAGIGIGSAGVLAVETVNDDFIRDLVTALGLHRVWDRAISVMASAAPPAQ